MPDLERLEVNVIERLPTLYRSPSFNRLLHEKVESLQLEDLRLMTSSSIREVVVEARKFYDGEETAIRELVGPFSTCDDSISRR